MSVDVDIRENDILQHVLSGESYSIGIFILHYMKRVITCLFAYLVFLIPSIAQTTITMEKDGGVYKVPCKVNGLKLKFIFDTGAATVSISSSVANMMLENDYLDKSDIKGSGASVLANGEIVDHTKINLREIEIGGLKLRNVEAIVIHQQSAQLLLGQSAIQRLGKVSISGNNLIINTYSSQVKNSGKTYSENELLQILNEAGNLYANNNYMAAAEKFEILEANNSLQPMHVSMYAACLSGAGRHDEALQKYLSSVEWTEENRPEELGTLYLNLSEEAFFCNDFYESIRYGGLGQVKSSLLSWERCAITRRICWAYIRLGDTTSALNIANRYLSNFFSFMEISPTDCWTKGYRDEYVAIMYYTIAGFYETYAEGKKQFIISAAWGNKDAIEVCNKFMWDFSKKPYEFVY